MKNANFIKTPKIFDKGFHLEEPCPRFRRHFTADKGFTKALLSVCGLGCGEYYLNGKIVTQDKFIAPFSDYNKTLWYNTYDVTELIADGDNTAAVYLGFAFFNENHKTAWDHNEAPWRDNPKFAFKLELIYPDKTECILSDDNWKCSDDGYIRFSQIRSGEYVDLRLLEDWTSPDYDDSDWDSAVVDDRPPVGVFRECLAEPMRECEIFPTKSITKIEENKYVFDIGENISGYVRLKVKGESGQQLTLRYAERFEDGELNYLELDMLNFEAPFQVDKLILSGEELVWSPRFTYYGFRFVEIDGLTEEPTPDMLEGVFLRHIISVKSQFQCSNEKINRLWNMGVRSVLSNLYYMPTDCPTREKYGWTNDARASAEQMLLNFSVENIMEKWMQDIRDSMRDDGSMPGIIPTPGWGYEWGSGPISNGILFELPYREYLINGNPQWLKENTEYFLRYLHYLESKEDEKGLVGIGLCDWAGPYETFESSPVPLTLSDTALYINFLDITALALRLSDDSREKDITSRRERIADNFKREFIGEDGRCTVSEQSALALIIDFGIYDNLSPLAEQLKAEVEKHDFHHYCGMLGLRHLYYALSKTGRSDYALKILTSEGFPSFMEWIDERDATSLCESWRKDSSYNHHMYSFFMAWLMQTLGGINTNVGSAPCENLIIAPQFLEGIDYCRVSNNGYEVYWQRNGNRINVEITVPQGGFAELQLPDKQPEILPEGNYLITV